MGGSNSDRSGSKKRNKNKNKNTNNNKEDDGDGGGGESKTNNSNKRKNKHRKKHSDKSNCNKNKNNNDDDDENSFFNHFKKQGDFNCIEDYILYFFKRMLKEWEKDLSLCSESEKMSLIGKNEAMRQKQTRRDIKPLFKQLKHKTVPIDVLEKTLKMVIAARNKNYVEAKRIFFEMAIGNAPWPMGVTMVGIHERSGRSKIFSSQIAHVMNDETQRKYIHAMERLIKYCQSKFPNADPVFNMG